MATRPNDDTGEIPLSQTLESLLTNVEFEIEGSISTVNNTAATEFDTEGSISTENTTKDESLPEHKFVPKVIIGKTGKFKGVKRTAWTLVMGPHDYKKSKNYKEWGYFYCNACLKLKTIVSAIAIHHVGEDEHGADDSFELI